MAKVVVGQKYVYNPVGLDIFDARTKLIKGDIVRVVNLRSCPPANTMGHCYVVWDISDEFAGLVLTASLEKVTK